LEAATVPGGLAGVSLEWSADMAVSVVLASGGYPASSSLGDVIRRLDRVPPGVHVTHAGTALNDSGEVVTAGGRVMNVTGLGADATSAREAAYAAAGMIEFDGKQMRRDIALRVAQPLGAGDRP
jgi:phosphoribosylamine--glycine ligase